ncbi:MAG: hypothetical protein GY799_19905 [Desulfobulbaceae bacterium]|nr:hypothetical protein [Desulfobulbaceae bacterium]
MHSIPLVEEYECSKNDEDITQNVQIDHPFSAEVCGKYCKVKARDSVFEQDYTHAQYADISALRRKSLACVDKNNDQETIDENLGD